MRFQLQEEEEESEGKVSDIPNPMRVRSSAVGVVKRYSENPPGPPQISAQVKISFEDEVVVGDEGEEEEWREGKRSKR